MIKNYVIKIYLALLLSAVFFMHGVIIYMEGMYQLVLVLAAYVITYSCHYQKVVELIKMILGYKLWLVISLLAVFVDTYYVVMVSAKMGNMLLSFAFMIGICIFVTSPIKLIIQPSN